MIIVLEHVLNVLDRNNLLILLIECLVNLTEATFTLLVDQLIPFLQVLPIAWHIILRLTVEVKLGRVHCGPERRLNVASLPLIIAVHRVLKGVSGLLHCLMVGLHSLKILFLYEV